jgi:hypothetical protein
MCQSQWRRLCRVIVLHFKSSLDFGRHPTFGLRMQPLLKIKDKTFKVPYRLRANRDRLGQRDVGLLLEGVQELLRPSVIHRQLAKKSSQRSHCHVLSDWSCTTLAVTSTCGLLSCICATVHHRPRKSRSRHGACCVRQTKERNDNNIQRRPLTD